MKNNKCPLKKHCKDYDCGNCNGCAVGESIHGLRRKIDNLKTENLKLEAENERLQKLCKLREKDHNDTLDLLYKEEKENERLKAELEKRPPRLVITKLQKGSKDENSKDTAALQEREADHYI